MTRSADTVATAIAAPRERASQLPPTFERRLERARTALEHEHADWLLVPASADFRWLTGATARSTERLVALAVPRRGAAFAIVPRLEADALAHECPWLELDAWADGDDPFERLARRVNLVSGPALLVGEGMRTAPLLKLAARARCRPAAAALADLRAVKDDEEIRALELAASHADRVVEETADFMRAGMTEREVAAWVMARFESLGDRLPWAIVASGPNGALPHHFTSERRLEDGDVVVLDLGAYTADYGSDITRVYWLGTPDDEAVHVYEIVNRARAAGISASRDGVPAENVDHAARGVIEQAGYGERFLHRTGHGVGLEVHELPYLVAGNRAPLRTGMVHSVEPGIYLAGRFGVRLEDLVRVGQERAIRLNQAPFDPRPPRLRS
jgi:Xaa-Pro aminopeptidase